MLARDLWDILFRAVNDQTAVYTCFAIQIVLEKLEFNELSSIFFSYGWWER